MINDLAPSISIREMSQRSGVPSSTLRYYEKLGLIASERQGHSEQRRYSESTFHKITYITLAQRAGFSLEEIAIQLTRVPDRFPLTKRHWGPLSEAWNTRIDQRIAEFKQLKIDIADCASRSSGRKY